MADDRVIFEIRAENDQLKAKLAETEAKLESLKTTAEKADDTGLGFKKSVSAVRSWIGAVGGAIAVATSFYAIGSKIRETVDKMFESGSEKAARFAATLDTIGPERVKKLQAELQRLYDLQADANSNLIRQAYQFLNGNSLSQLSEQIKEQATALVDAAKAVEGLEEQAAAKKKKADDDADKEARQRADDRYAQEEQANEEARQRRTQQALDDANALADATLSEEEKIARKRFDNIERAKRLLTQAVTEQDRFAAESLIKAANLNARFELKKLEDEREKKRLETEKKAADKYADTLEDRLRKFYDEINRANREFGTTLGDRLNGTLEAIRQDINRIRLTIPQNGGGGYPPGGSY